MGRPAGAKRVKLICKTCGAVREAYASSVKNKMGTSYCSPACYQKDVRSTRHNINIKKEQLISS